VFLVFGWLFVLCHSYTLFIFLNVSVSTVTLCVQKEIWDTVKHLMLITSVDCMHNFTIKLLNY